MASDMSDWTVYMLRCSDNSLYTGITTDIERRIREHNGSGRGARYTRGRQPVSLAWMESVASRSEACRREHQVRNLNRLKKQALMADFNATINT
jgi:putative endonuclease